MYFNKQFQRYMHFFVLHTFRLDKTGGKYKTEYQYQEREKIVEDNEGVTI